MDKQLFRNATRHKIIQTVTFLFVIFCITSTLAQQKDTLLCTGIPS